LAIISKFGVKLKHIKEFNRFATSYQEYKIVQTLVAKHLISNIKKRGENILDLGAGSGEVYKNINWKIKSYYAVDLSYKMLNLHPDSEKIICDFDTKECWLKLKKLPIDMVISSSALQWSRNFDFLCKNLSNITSNVNFAIFTSNTFKTIQKITSLPSPILSKEEIIDTINSYFLVNYEIREYKLFFNDKTQMFRYIKKSGVSDGSKKLGYKETKELIAMYPYNYLEFEVVFAWSKS
jgi:malonyl-CoA O-methyltransferase